MASADGEGPSSVRAVQSEPRQGTPERLAGDVEDHAGEGDDAGEEGGEGDGWADVAAAGRGEGVDEERGEEEVGETAKGRGKERHGGVDTGLGCWGSGGG